MASVVDKFKAMAIFFFVLKMATAMCLYGTTSANPGKSCAEILRMDPECLDVSGNYWIMCKNMSTPVNVYCDMYRLGGGWMRLAVHDFAGGDPCQQEWKSFTGHNGIAYCTTTDGIPSASWFFDNICPFAEVNAAVYADQRGLLECFAYKTSKRLDDNYVDGVSITVNSTTGKRQHIFTYAAARDAFYTSGPNIIDSCDCHGSHFATDHYPQFVQYDYLCDSGYRNGGQSYTQISRRNVWSSTLGTNPIYDCANPCCYAASSPWFYKSLPTMMDSAIEFRILTDQNHAEEMILVSGLTLYVR